MRILLFLLSLGCISEGLAQELFSEQFTPLTRLTKPNAKEKSGSIDSTFIFASDTLQLPVFDDF
jgi:hypothetical protein